MKKELTFSLLLLFLPFTIFAGTNPSQQSLDLIKESNQFLSQIFPVSEGSENEALVYEYIKMQLDFMHLAYQFSPLDKLEFDHSFSSNLVVEIPGVLDDQFILVVPIHIQQEVSINVSLAIGFINEWKNNPPPLTLVLLFTGADERQEHPLGTLNFLEDHSFAVPSAVLYYAIRSSDLREEIKGSTPGYTTPGWYMQKLTHAAESSDVTFHINIPEFLINKSRIDTAISPITFYLSEEIPAISISSNETIQDFHNPDLFAKSHLEMLNSLSQSLAEGIPNDWERNYLYANLYSYGYYYISETLLILIFLTFFAFAILIPVVQERKIYLNFKRFRHQLWTLPVLLFLTFQFFMLSTLTIEEILVYRNLPELVGQYPFIFLLFKLSIILFLSGIMLNILRGLPFPKSPHFYSYLAFLFSLLNVFYGMLINIAYSLFPLWILICATLFIIVKGKGKKQLFLYISLFPVLVVLFYIVQGSYLSVYQFFLLSRVKGNVILTLLSLPFTSMITSLSFYHHHYEKSRQEVRAAVGVIIWGLITFFMTYQIMHMQDYTEKSPQKIVMQDMQDLDSGIREIQISSRGEIGDGRLILHTKTIDLEGIGRELKVQGEIEEGLLTTSATSDLFLDRRTVILDLSAAIPPAEIELRVFSDKPIVFYDCEYPYEVLPDEKSARIFIGQNPPNPIRLPMVFSRDSEPNFLIRLKYNETPYSLIMERENVTVDSSMSLKKSLLFQSIDSN